MTDRDSRGTVLTLYDGVTPLPLHGHEEVQPRRGNRCSTSSTSSAGKRNDVTSAHGPKEAEAKSKIAPAASGSILSPKLHRRNSRQSLPTGPFSVPHSPRPLTHQPVRSRTTIADQVEESQPSARTESSSTRTGTGNDAGYYLLEDSLNNDTPPLAAAVARFSPRRMSSELRLKPRLANGNVSSTSNNNNNGTTTDHAMDFFLHEPMELSAGGSPHLPRPLTYLRTNHVKPTTSAAGAGAAAKSSTTGGIYTIRCNSNSTSFHRGNHARSNANPHQDNTLSPSKAHPHDFYTALMTAPLSTSHRRTSDGKEPQTHPRRTRISVIDDAQFLAPEDTPTAPVTSEGAAQESSMLPWEQQQQQQRGGRLDDGVSRNGRSFFSVGGVTPPQSFVRTRKASVRHPTFSGSVYRAPSSASLLWPSVYGNNKDAASAKAVQARDVPSELTRKSEAVGGFYSFLQLATGLLSPPEGLAQTTDKGKRDPASVSILRSSMLPGVPMLASPSSDGTLEDRGTEEEVWTAYVNNTNGSPVKGRPITSARTPEGIARWQSLYGMAFNSNGQLSLMTGDADTKRARPPSILRSNTTPESVSDSGSGGDGTSRSGESQRRCSLDRKATMNALEWVRETGKGRLHSSSDSDDDDKNNNNDNGTVADQQTNAEHVERHLSQLLARAHRRTSAGSAMYVADNHSHSSEDVMDNVTSSDEDEEESLVVARRAQRRQWNHRSSLLVGAHDDGPHDDEDEDDEHEEGSHDDEDFETAAAEEEVAEEELVDAVSPPLVIIPTPPREATKNPSNGQTYHGRGAVVSGSAPPSYRVQIPPPSRVLPAANAQRGGWGAGAGARAATYLHHYGPDAGRSPQMPMQQDALWSMQPAVYGSPMTSYAQNGYTHVPVRSVSPVTVVPSSYSSPPPMFRQTLTAMKVHDLLGFDPETEIHTVHSPVWQYLP